jgi:hypothetical protein
MVFGCRLCVHDIYLLIGVATANWPKRLWD